MSDPFTDRLFEDEESQHSRERRAARKEELEKKRAREEKAKALAKKRSALAKKYVLIALAVLLVILALFGRLLWQIKNLAQEKEALQDVIDGKNQQIEDLQSEYDRVTSLEYIEQEARSQLRMIYPDEVLYVVD